MTWMTSMTIRIEWMVLGEGGGEGEGRVAKFTWSSQMHGVSFYIVFFASVRLTGFRRGQKLHYGLPGKRSLLGRKNRNFVGHYALL